MHIMQCIKVDFFASMEWELKSDFPRKRHFPDDFKAANGKLDSLQALKALYDKNDFSQKAVQGNPIIPKMIHQIWVGPISASGNS